MNKIYNLLFALILTFMTTNGLLAEDKARFKVPLEIYELKHVEFVRVNVEIMNSENEVVGHGTSPIEVPDIDRLDRTIFVEVDPDPGVNLRDVTSYRVFIELVRKDSNDRHIPVQDPDAPDWYRARSDKAFRVDFTRTL